MKLQTIESEYCIWIRDEIPDRMEMRVMDLLKIDKKIKKPPAYFYEVLGFIGTQLLRSSVITMILLINFFIIIPLIEPHVPVFLYIIVPLLVIVNIWGIRLLVTNPYSTQFEFVLYCGVYGAVSALSFFLMSEKFAYYLLRIHFGNFYYVMTTILFVLSAVALLYYQIWKFSGYRKNVGYDRTAKYSALLPIAPSLGYTFSHSTSKNEYVSGIILVVLYYLIGIFWAYVGAKFIHKYFFMKHNVHMVKFERPKGNSKEAKAMKKAMKIK